MNAPSKASRGNPRTGNKKIIVWRTEVLPYSETFIKEQITSYQRWEAVLAGQRQIPGLSLKGIRVRTFQPQPPNHFRRIQWRAHRALWTFPHHVSVSLRDEHASLFHVHFGNDAVAVWPLVKKLQLPMIVTLHGYDIAVKREWWEAGNAGHTMTMYPRRLLKMAQHSNVRFLAVSEAVKRQAIEYGIPAAKLTTCYIGIDRKKFSPGSIPIVARRRRILFVGRLVEKKGSEYLLRAMQEVEKHVPDAEVVIIGDGPKREELTRLAEALKIRAHFLGKRSPEEVRAELDVARVFCLPSVVASNGDTEGLPISILEAQSCGIPVVTSANGGASEGIIDGETGFAFVQRDVVMLADRLVALLQDDALATRLSVQAPEFIKERFDLRACTGSLEQIYDETLERI